MPDITLSDVPCDILVTGGGGMVGKALKAALPQARFLRRCDCDLEDALSVQRLFRELQPKAVIHLAALVGGIRDNVSRPYDFFFHNVSINTNLIQAAVTCGVEYLIGVSSTCAYPGETSTYPMEESQLHLGPPAAENLPYGYAKRCMSVQLDAAQAQYGLRRCVLYPCNLYGPNDSFHPSKSHLVSALIRKVHLGKVNSVPFLDLLGTGRPRRQFMYAADLARSIASVAELRLEGHFNVAIPDNPTVDEIAATVQAVICYTVPRRYSGTLDGQYRKDASSAQLLNDLPGFTFTPLRDGVRSTYEWYLQNIAPKEHYDHCAEE